MKIYFEDIINEANKYENNLEGLIKCAHEHCNAERLDHLIKTFENVAMKIIYKKLGYNDKEINEIIYRLKLLKEEMSNKNTKI